MHRLSAEHGVFGADELDQHGCRCPKQNASTGELRPQPPVKRTVIEAPSYGKVSFAIPYMRDYLYEHKAELEVEL